jgi:hypothetical protein
MNWIRWGRKWKAMSLLPSPLPPKGSLLFCKLIDFVFYVTADTKFHSYYKSHTTEIILLSTSLNINNSGTESQ